MVIVCSRSSTVNGAAVCRSSFESARKTETKRNGKTETKTIKFSVARKRSVNFLGPTVCTIDRRKRIAWLLFHVEMSIWRAVQEQGWSVVEREQAFAE